MHRLRRLLLLAPLFVLAGCSPFPVCTGNTFCDNSTRTCETICAPDAGTSQCPSGKSCVLASGCCEGTACDAAANFVCR
jgi:hypothetical protein